MNCTTMVVSKRVSKSREGAGIVQFRHQCVTQGDKLVAECLHDAFIIMRPN